MRQEGQTQYVDVLLVNAPFPQAGIRRLGHHPARRNQGRFARPGIPSKPCPLIGHCSSTASVQQPMRGFVLW